MKYGEISKIVKADNTKQYLLITLDEEPSDEYLNKMFENGWHPMQILMKAIQIETGNYRKIGESFTLNNKYEFLVYFERNKTHIKI